MKNYVQFGAGSEAIEGWKNYDSSPTLLIQKTPVLGKLLKGKLNCQFDDSIIYGDIVRGLPLKQASVDILFCSHVLEHLTKSDLHIALSNCFYYLKSGGVFRVIVPDLKEYALNYLKLQTIGVEMEDSYSELAADFFVKATGLGEERKRSGLKSRISQAFGNSRHQWMYDRESLEYFLASHGFVDIQSFNKGDSDDPLLLAPERDRMFVSHGLPCLALQCRKP
jgi:predicted SAM-dependent methyltransferase